MAYGDRGPQNQQFTSLPSRAGDARHTLAAGPLAEMTQMLAEHSPTCTSTALTLLRTHFPERPVEDHLQALTFFCERLSNASQ